MEYGFEVESRFHERYNPIARKIFRLLSENSRASISEMSNALGISRRTISERLKKLESETGLRYTLELNEANLGLNNPHLILVKFDAKPDYAKIREMLHSSYIPQLAVTMKGTEQMIIYANARTGKEYAHWDRSMRMMLAKYRPSWQPSEVAHRQLGFFPLRGEILDKTTVPEKYKPMLKLLNRNSRMSFQDISKDLNMNFNTAAYNFNNLRKMSYIDRFTSTIAMPQGTTFVAFFSKYTPSEGYE
ncbi:MAG: Lrp/AsnC family transcriptional regulator, partial [Candidatus Micrarchaeaceae archaeon]